MEGDLRLNPRKIILAQFDVPCNAEVVWERKVSKFLQNIG